MTRAEWPGHEGYGPGGPIQNGQFESPSKSEMQRYGYVQHEETWEARALRSRLSPDQAERQRSPEIGMEPLARAYARAM